MLSIHWGNGEGHEKELGDGFLECFLGALDDVGISQDAELRATLRDYMEWAVADVTAYASRDTSVPSNVPVPRWSWDGLQQRS
jgi:hemoglobin